MFKQSFLYPLALLLLTGCAPQTIRQQQIQLSGHLPSIAAEFETTITDARHGDHESQPQHYRWRFHRTANSVTTHNLEDNSGESWHKAADGSISYQRVFHAQRQIIDYLPGDLKAIGATPEWTAIASLLNQAMIAPLHADDSEDILGRSAIRYRNDNPEQPLDVVWLDHEQLPGLIERREHDHTVVTRILATYPLTQAPWSVPDTSDYRYIDFADIGDKENDPFIKSILPKIKGGHHHNH